MADAKIKLYLLGTPQVWLNDAPLAFDTRKALALLAYLAVTARRQSRDILAALLWGELDQTNARGSLRRTLSTLNKGLQGTGLAIERETITLIQSPQVWADVNEFNHHLQTAKAELANCAGKLAATTVNQLEQAVNLWQGDFMQGFSLKDSVEFDEWQHQTDENLRREVEWGLEKLVEEYAAVPDFEKALKYARRWLTFDPLNEAAHRQLMQLYAMSNQTSLALKQYLECVQILERELGVPPLEVTTALYTAIKERRLSPPTPSQSSMVKEPAAPTQTLPAVTETPYLPLVGRAAEWQTLETAWQTVLQTGQGRLIVIEGEAGIGKTRLVEDFLSQQAATGYKVTKASCYEGENEMAFVPVSTLLKKAMEGTPAEEQLENIEAEWRIEATRLVPGLGINLPSAPAIIENFGAQGRFYEGLRQVLLSLGGLPGLIFLDDVQWIDGASLDFLSYLARRLPEQPVGLVLAWRSGTLSTLPKLAQLFVTAKRQNYATFATLDRLSQEESAALVRTALPFSTPELNRRLYHETEGLPFFLVEYLEAYQRGLFGSGDFAGDGIAVVPVGVCDLLESRVQALSETARQLLESAAVIGPSFDFDMLGEVSGRSEAETVAGLEELATAALLILPQQSSPNLRYDFSHEKLRTQVYENLSPPRRRLLHRRTAEAFSKLKTTGEPLYTQIAYHYRQSGREVAAATYYKLAGDYARALFANREALNHYQTALALGYNEVSALRETMADIYVLLGEYNSALHQYQLAAQEPQAQARLEYKAGKIYLWRGDWHLSLHQFESALGLVGENLGLAAQIYTDWSLALHRLGQSREARVMAEKALEQAVKAADQRAQAQALNILGLLAGQRGETAVALGHLRESLALSETLAEKTLQAAALNNLAKVRYNQGELAEAIELTRTALEIVARLGDRHREAALLSNLGDLYQANTQPQKARESVKESVRIYTEIGVEAGTFQPGIWMLTDW